MGLHLKRQKTTNGWLYFTKGVGNFGTDYLLRGSASSRTGRAAGRWTGSNCPPGQVMSFDGLQARWMGHVDLPKDVNLSQKGSSAYKPTQVHRNSVMTFNAGAELCGKWVTERIRRRILVSAAASIPSLNFTPPMSFGN